jgi:hypothetical protein
LRLASFLHHLSRLYGEATVIMAEGPKSVEVGARERERLHQ